jgi:hypothetical protein
LQLLSYRFRTRWEIKYYELKIQTKKKWNPGICADDPRYSWPIFSFIITIIIIHSTERSNRVINSLLIRRSEFRFSARDDACVKRDF